MRNIVVVDGVPLSGEQLKRIDALGNLRVYKHPPSNRNELIKRLADAHITLVSEVRLDKDILRASSHLQMISLWSAGFDHVDIQSAADLGITVCHAPGCTATAIAEYTIGVALYFLQRLDEADRHVRQGGYSWERFITAEFHRQVFGIIGLGNIGTRVAEYAQILGAKVLAHTRTPSSERADRLGVTFVDLETLLQQSDIISINTALTPRTAGMIGPREFAQMARHPILINTARGKLVDQTALVQALRMGHIRAACLDVLADEPPDPQDPLLQMENVLFTPHCSSATSQGFGAQSELCVQNVEAFLSGKSKNIVAQ